MLYPLNIPHSRPSKSAIANAGCAKGTRAKNSVIPMPKTAEKFMYLLAKNPKVKTLSLIDRALNPRVTSENMTVNMHIVDATSTPSFFSGHIFNNIPNYIHHTHPKNMIQLLLLFSVTSLLF